MTAAYNDIEPFVCRVLRARISDGSLPGGEVIEGPVQEIDGADPRLRGVRQFHAFAGIGAWGLACRWVGWPEHLSLLTASPPCQPFSCAGRRAGSDDVRNLWHDTLRLLRDLGPEYAVFENVPGLLSIADGRFFADLLGSISDLGYRAGWSVFSAADVGAPHQRNRVFIVCHSERGGCEGQSRRGTGTEPSDGHLRNEARNGDLADANGKRQPQPDRTDGEVERRSGNSGVGLADAEIQGSPIGQWAGGTTATRSGSERGRVDVENTQRIGRNPPSDRRGIGLADADLRSQIGASVARRERDPGQPESGLGRDAPRIRSWLDGSRWPAPRGAAQYDWEPPRTVAGQTPNRGARLKALGNAVVPQCAAMLLQAILESREADR